jgi:hypothetical protein
MLVGGDEDASEAPAMSRPVGSADRTFSEINTLDRASFLVLIELPEDHYRGGLGHPPIVINDQ